MVETALFFILGFLCAGFLALMVAPSIWRRAVVLTRRRIEASIPLSFEEIQAEKDHLRAEHAMAIRRLERSVSELREKSASQLIEINRNREEMARMAEEREAAGRDISDLEARIAGFDDGSRQRDEQLRDVSEQLEAARARLAVQAADLEEMSNLFQETSLVSSSRQIELVAREAEIENLTAQIGAVRSEREEWLERHGRDLARLKEQLTEATTAKRSLDTSGDEDALLREQIHDLAAEVVNMTALLDGPDSPIRRILSESQTPAIAAGGERITSLADRIRALQQAAVEK